MLTTRVRTLLVCSALAAASACSSSSSTPTAPSPVAIAQPVTVTLVQGSEASAAPHPVRVAFDGFAGLCDDTVDTSCLAAFMPTFRVQVGSGAYTVLPVQQLGTERRFQ